MPKPPEASATPLLMPASGSDPGSATGTGTGAGSAGPSPYTSYTTLDLQFDFSSSTADTASSGEMPVGYKGVFTPEPWASLNVTDMLYNVSIFPTYVNCKGELFHMCVFETEMLTTAQLNALRALNGTVSASWTPLPIAQYVGAFNTTPAFTLSVADALVRLAEEGLDGAYNVSCADTDCVFASTHRAMLALARRAITNGALSTAAIGQTFVQPDPVPLLKRAITVSVDNNELNITADEVLAAVNLIGVQPNDVSCADNVCVMQTYDPLQPHNVALLQTALPTGSFVSGITYFSSTELVFANPSPSHSSDPTSAVFAALVAGIAPYSASCDASNCTLLTHAVVSMAQLNALQGVLGGGEVLMQRLNQTASAALMFGDYSTSMTLRDWASADAVLLNANVTDSFNMSCPPSLTLDNAVDCTFLTPEPLTDAQLFALREQAGVTQVSPSQPVTFASAFEQALQRVLGEYIGCLFVVCCV